MDAKVQSFLDTLDERLHEAVQFFWEKRDSQMARQTSSGRTDAGSRGAVTGGGHLAALEALLDDAVRTVDDGNIRIIGGRSGSSSSNGRLEMPGYYRPEKKWDFLVLWKGHLVAAVEFKSQVGPSFGNNANNRAEEAIGSAEDFQKAFREKRFGSAIPPFLGYFFLLEDCAEVKTPVRLSEPHFDVDPIFKPHTSYARRYQILAQRLVQEKLYSATCLVLATKAMPTVLTEPDPQLNFRLFVTGLISQVERFVMAQPAALVRSPQLLPGSLFSQP